MTGERVALSLHTLRKFFKHLFIMHAYNPDHKGLGVYGNNQARPCSSHVFSTEIKRAAMQKPGNNTKAFGSSRQVVHK